MRILLPTLALMGALIPAPPAGAAMELALAEPRRAVFAGQPTALRFRVEGQPSPGASLYWELTGNGRRLASGRAPLDEEGGIQVAVEAPDMREGLVFEARLRAGVLSPDDDWISNRVTRALDLVGRPLVAARGPRPAERDLKLYDPGGDTAAALDRAAIPYQRVDSIEAPQVAGSDVLLLGEGSDLRGKRRLTGHLTQLAQAGLRVVALAPESLGLDLDGRQVGRSRPAALSLSRRPPDSARKAEWYRAWRARAGDAGTGGLRIARYGSISRVAVAGDDPGWHWLEAEYPRRGGRLVVYTESLLADWDDSPSPRQQLLAILDHVSTD